MKRFLKLFVLILILSACAENPSDPVVEPINGNEAATSFVEPEIPEQAVPTEDVILSDALIDLSSSTFFSVQKQFGRGVLSRVSYSPDEKWIGAATSLGMYIFDAESLEEIHFFDLNDWITDFDWSLESDRIVVAIGSDLFIVDAETGEILEILLGHTDDVNSLAWSPDGKLIVSVSDDMTARIWDAATGELVTLINMYSGIGRTVLYVDWSPGGDIVYIQNYEGAVSAWDPITGENLLYYSEVYQQPYQFSVSPDGSKVAISSLEAAIQILDSKTGVTLLDIQRFSEGQIYEYGPISWSPDGKYLLSGARYEDVYIWDAETGEPYKMLRVGPNGINSVSWMLDGSKLLTGGSSGSIQIWETEDFTEIASIDGFSGPFFSLDLSPDNQWIAAGNNIGDVFIYPFRDEGAAEKLYEHDTQVVAVEWSPDNTKIASIDDNWIIEVWDVETRAFETQYSKYPQGDAYYLADIAWSSDGDRFVKSIDQGDIAVINTLDGETIDKLQGHTSDVVTLAWSPDGTKLASGGWDGYIYIWDMEQYSRIVNADLDVNGVMAVEWSPDANMLAVGIYDYENYQVRILETDSLKEIFSLDDVTNDVYALAWSPDGKNLAVGAADEFVRVYSFGEAGESPILEDTFYSGTSMALDWSADSKKLIGANWNGTIVVWDLVDGEKVESNLSKSDQDISSYVYDLDLQYLITGNVGGEVSLWDRDGNEALANLSLAESGILDLQWSPNGKYLVSETEDNSIYILEIQEERFKLVQKFEYGPYQFAWSPYFNHLVIADQEGSVRMFDGLRMQEWMDVDFGVEVTEIEWDALGKGIEITFKDKSQVYYYLDTKKTVEILYQGEMVVDAAYSPDEQHVAYVGAMLDVVIENLVSGDKQRLSGHTETVINVAWSHDGTKIATGDVGGTILVWTMPAGELVYTLSGHTSGVDGLSWSPDDSQLASGAWDSLLMIWDMETGEADTTYQVHEGDIIKVDWSPNGDLIATAAWDGTIRVLWAETGLEKYVFEIEGSRNTFDSVAFSPDGSMIAGGTRTGAVLIWSATTGAEIYQYNMHASVVTDLQWSADGTRMISGSEEATVKGWNVSTGEVFFEFKLSDMEVYAISWSSDENQIIIGILDGEVLLYRLED